MPSDIGERRAALEVLAGSYKLLLVSFPLLPFKWRRRIYKWYVYRLGEVAFNIYIEGVVEALCFKERNSRQFQNTKTELENILKWLPRFNKYRGILRENIIINRRKYGLKV